MSGNFRVCSADGKQFFVSQISTLQALFRSGRIDAETRVLVPGGEEYRPLREIINISQGNPVNPPAVEVNNGAANFAQPLVAATAPIPPATYDYVDAEDGDERPNPGLRAAGILLLINAAFICLGLIVMVLRGDQFSNAKIGSVILLVDLVIGSGLVYGKWQSLGLVRACAGGIIFGFIIPLFAEGPSDLMVGILQIITACGLFVLIYGKRASTVRIVLGITIVTIGWLGVQTVYAINYLIPTIREASQAGLDKNSVAGRTINDTEVGVSVELPDDWLEVNVAAVLEHQHARMMLSNTSVGGEQAVFRVESHAPSSGITTPADYMNGVIRGNPAIKNLGISTSDFGQMFSADPPKRMEISFQADGLVWHGWIAVCKRGSNFYVLMVYGPETNKDRAYSEYLKLESAFKIDK